MVTNKFHVKKTNPVCYKNPLNFHGYFCISSSEKEKKKPNYTLTLYTPQ